MTLPRLVAALGLAMLVPAALVAPARAESRPGATAKEREISEAVQPPRRVVVDRFHGAGAESARNGAISALEQEDAVDVVAVELVEAQPEALDGSAQSYIELSRRLNLSALVRGKIKHLTTEPKKPYLATLTVINGGDGLPIGKVTFSAGSVALLRSRMATELWAALGPLIGKCSSPRRAESESESESEAERSSRPLEVEAPRPPKRITYEGDEARVPPPVPRIGARRFPSFELEASAGSLWRTFDYRDEQRGALRAYVLRFAPVAQLDAVFYPFSLSSRGPSAGLGLRAGFEPLLHVTSRLAERRLSTRAYAYHAELVWRLPVGAFAFQPALGFAERRYEVAEGVVPNVAYRSLLASLGVQLRAAWFVAELAGGGRFVLDAGELESAAWFPKASGFGLDANAQVGVGIGNWLDLLLGAEAELYRLDFHAPSGAPELGAFPNGIAQGASDRYLRALFSVRFRLSKGWPVE